MHKNRKIYPVLVLFLLFLLNQAQAAEVLTWQDCIREAAKNHPDLIAAGAQIKQSEAGKNITASALYPQINSNLSASTVKTFSGTGGSSTADTYTYGVTGTQLVFDGLKTINEVNTASENLKASKENFKFASATIRQRLRVAFSSLLRAQELLRITQQIYDIRRANLELITLRYESGLEHKGALLTAEADLANAVYGIDQAKRGLEVAQRGLLKEMGRSALVPIEIKGDFQVKDAASKKPDFEALTKNNPSLLKLIAQKNAAEFSLRSAYANFFPTLTGQAGANKSAAHWPPQNDGLWNLGLALSMPIFEGGLRFAQVSQAKASLTQLEENERSARDSVILTLEETWAVLQDTIENVEVQRKNLIATEERSRIAQAEYSIGFITFDNWTIIEDNLVSAKRNFLDAEASALIAEANWVQAKGETLEYE
jgi:outer membrane protein TolC